MADSRFEVTARSFLGIVNDVDPHDLPPGAMQTQENLRIDRRGELVVRNGLTALSLPRSAGEHIISIHRFEKPGRTWLVYHTSGGKVMAVNPDDYTTTLELKTGFSAEQPACFAQSRQGVLIAVNGIDRGIRWDGCTSTAEELGMDAPVSAPSVALGSGGNAEAGVYKCAIRFLDDDEEYDEFLTGTGNGYPSSFSAITTVTATAGQKFTWTGLNVAVQSRVAKVQLWRTSVDQGRVFYLVAEIAYASAGAGYEDTLSDDDLIANQYIPLYTADGRHEIANRFTPPPSDLAYAAFLQDRLFLAGSIPYVKGDISLTSGSPTATGTGTAWPATVVGRYLYVREHNTCYKITARPSATSLTLNKNATSNVASESYAIVPSSAKNNTVYFSESDEPEAFPARNSVTIQHNDGDADYITGLAPNNTELIVGQSNHLYSISFFRQPDVDANASLVANRGMLNNRCWARYDSSLLCMDKNGFYAVRGGDIDDGVDFGLAPDSKYFFALANRCEGYVRWHVNESGTGSNLVWLEYSPGDNTWSKGSFAPGLYSGTTIDGQTVYGGINSRLYLEGGDYTDHAQTTATETATGATSSTISRSTANYTDDVLDSPVTIIMGTGRGQTRYVTARTSTQLTVNSNWTTTPDSTSVFVLGGIPFSMKTGILDNGGRGDNERNAVDEGVIIVFQPTADTNGAIYMRKYIDTETSAAVNSYLSMNMGDYVTAVIGETDFRISTYIDTTGEKHAGWAKVRTGSHRDPRMLSDRYVAFEFEGYTSGYPVKIYELTTLSAE